MGNKTWDSFGDGKFGFVLTLIWIVREAMKVKRLCLQASSGQACAEAYNQKTRPEIRSD